MREVDTKTFTECYTKPHLKVSTFLLSVSSNAQQYNKAQPIMDSGFTCLIRHSVLFSLVLNI